MAKLLRHDREQAGPIMTRYHIQSIPAIYVLDRKGIIRARDIHGDALDKCAESLLSEPPSRSGFSLTRGASSHSESQRLNQEGTTLASQDEFLDLVWQDINGSMQEHWIENVILARKTTRTPRLPTWGLP